MPVRRPHDTDKVSKKPADEPNLDESAKSPERVIARQLAKRFVQRRDVFARQHSDGTYAPVRRAIAVDDIVSHLAGRTTYGHYLVDHENKTRVIALDIDWDDSTELWDGQVVNPREIFSTDHAAKPELIERIRAISDGVAWRLKRMYPEALVLASFSGSKGIHVYACAHRPIEAVDARSIAGAVMASFLFQPVKGKNFWASGTHPGLKVETFPKQEKLGSKGYGNLLRLPLGVNQKTGQHSFFYDFDAPQTELRPMSPQRALQHGCITPKKGGR